MSCDKVAPANSEFAFALYKHAAAAQPQNVFFSPVSISTALAMLSLGARADTLSQIMQGLGFPPSETPVEEVHAGFQHLIELLTNPDSELQLSLGSALFIREGRELLQSFLDDVKKSYRAEAFSSNFTNEGEAKKQINHYVEERTKGKIVNLLKSLDPETALVLVNYVFFRGQWDKPFELESTREDDFHVDEHTTVKVPMMFQWTRLNTVFDSDLCATVVQMPYKGNASALFILPDAGKMKQLEDVLSRSTIKKWSQSMSYRPINLFIPKFSISSTLDLKDLLEKTGITDVFTDRADLSGITGACNLKVSKAVHQAVLRIDEKGTEAAGVTSLEAMPMCLPPTVKFDRPFLLVIDHSATENNLFMGRIVNPTAV